MSKGNTLWHYFPKGVMNVVNKNDSFLKGIYQNPELQSSFLKALEPDSCAKIWSILGSRLASLIIFSLSLNGSRQILTYHSSLVQQPCMSTVLLADQF